MPYSTFVQSYPTTTLSLYKYVVRTFQLVVGTLFAGALIGACTNAAAGTLSYTSVAFNPGSSWISGTDPTTGHAVASLDAGALAVGTTASYTENAVGSVQFNFQYLGTATDTPPSSITLTYGAKMVGSLGCYLLGRTPPSGSASGSYSGSVTKAGSMSSSTISNSFGPISQATTYVSYSPADTTMDVSNQVVSTPSWNSHDNGDGTYTYTLSITVLNASGTATASCDVNWKGSYSRASWYYQFDISSLTIH